MINPAIENDLKHISLNDVNYADYIKENYVPIEVLQEKKQDIDEWYQFPHSSLNWLCYTKLCEIFDKRINNDQFERIWQNTVEEMKRRKICEDILEEAEEWDSEIMSGSLLTDDDLRQLINDGINKCKEEHTYTPIKNNFDLSETGCTDKKCPFYLNPDYTRCKDCEEKRKAGIMTPVEIARLVAGEYDKHDTEQDKVTQWIKDNADFIKEMARMLEEAGGRGMKHKATSEFTNEEKGWMETLAINYIIAQADGFQLGYGQALSDFTDYIIDYWNGSDDKPQESVLNALVDLGVELAKRKEIAAKNIETAKERDYEKYYAWDYRDKNEPFGRTVSLFTKKEPQEGEE